MTPLARHLLLAGLALSLAAQPASARELYVANSGDGTVSVVEASTSSVVTSIPVGSEPSDVAMVPGGTRAYVVNTGGDSVTAIDVATRQVTVPAIPVGEDPHGIAVAPNGLRAYVTNMASDSVTVIDTGTNSVVGTIPLEAGAEPDGVAFTPNGLAAYVAQRAGGIAVISTATAEVTGSIGTTFGMGPSRLSIVPQGDIGFVTNSNSTSASLFSTIGSTIVGAPLGVGTNPSGVAVNPNGSHTYVAVGTADTVVAIDSAAHTVISPPIPGFESPAGIAVAPDGRRAYVSNAGGSTVSIVDTASNFGAGQIEVGLEPSGIAMVPNQAPKAALVAAGQAKAGEPTAFDAAASTDPDGRPATYSWAFGDGEEEVTQTPTTDHVYAKAGTYPVTLTVTDEEGCSASLRFTGQTVSCNGSATARTVTAVEVADGTPPEFLLSARRRQPISRRVVVVGTCPQERCRATAEGLLRTATPTPARTLRRKGKTRPAQTTLANGVERKLRLKLPKGSYLAARRALRREGRATVRVIATARDEAGNPRRRVARITLFEPRRERGGR